MTSDENSIPGAGLVSRSLSGPAAEEIHLQCRPHAGTGGIDRQTASVYQSVAALLRARGGSMKHLLVETVCFRNIHRDYEPYLKARSRSFALSEGPSALLPAITCIEQPPLDTDADLVTSAIAVIPRAGLPSGNEPEQPGVRRLLMPGGETHLFAGGIIGNPGTAYGQSYRMFCRAEEMLLREGMTFQNVVRTWIYLRHMERDYGEFNRARREFFHERMVTLLPASTGIYGSPHPHKADFILGLFAIRSPRDLEVSTMSTPTLNEACTYGSDFSRGLRVGDANKTALYISGTASVDEEGRTAHVEDFDRQVERMLVNVETLLSAQQAAFADVLSAVTYLKHAHDAPRFLQLLRERGLGNLPTTVVHAAVCRPDLLCEMEAIAVRPASEISRA